MRKRQPQPQLQVVESPPRRPHRDRKLLERITDPVARRIYETHLDYGSEADTYTAREESEDGMREALWESFGEDD